MVLTGVHLYVDNLYLTKEKLHCSRNGNCSCDRMKNIDHLPASEKLHFILCDCGEYLNMRDLGEVFKHMHFPETPVPEWQHSIKKGEPIAYRRGGPALGLN